ncbi:hypothetical protein INR49_029965 [Caranx melampygus]|nr:hypothetical protein INR49_029965 [Caranx melampygus]
MNDIEEKLDCPVTYCSSSSETYKLLQSHMEVCQAVEQLKPRLMALCSAMKRLGEGSQLEEEVANLQKQQGEFAGKAAEKQATLESLLALWQRFEKENSSMKSWLDRCESVCCPDTDLLSADKVKLRNELQNIQEMQEETQSYEVLLQGIVNLGLCLYPTAPEARIQELSNDLTQLQERCTSVKSGISHRFELLESQLSQLELFDQALLTLTQRSENFLSVLRSSSQVDTADLEAAITKLKEHEIQLESFELLRETLHQRESSLLCCSTPEAQQQLQGWKEDCLQPLRESQRLLLLRKECLTELNAFLEKHGTAAKAVHRLHEAVEGRGSWDRSKAEELHYGIGEVAKDVARLEAEAVGLDGQLSKAHLHLSGTEWQGPRDISHHQGRTSCRGQAVALTMALEEVQRGVGWRQSEADALGALWSSFRERREEVMKNLKKLEDEARHEGARESSVQAFQNRLRFFVQLEDELQSLQHSQQWLEEKGSQLAQRDSELAGEALREVALVKTAWENVRTLIADGQEQSGVVVDLLRLFQHLKSILSTVVENAQGVAHNLPDHNHNAQEARRTFTRHDIVQTELKDKQEDMDQLISTVEDLQRELEKVPNTDTQSIQREMETLRDQWLEISERIQTNTERLGYCVALWDDLKTTEQDIDEWTATSIADLTDSVTNLSDKDKAEAQLATFQAEVEKREQKLDDLQERVTKLRERAKLQETPLQMQVLESDLRKKMAHAQEVYNQAKHTLTYFSFQKQRLEDLMSQMVERLEAVEGSLSDLTEATSPEDIGTIKDLQSIVQQQRADMDSARDALTALCRSHPSQELSSLSSDLTSIAKRTEAVAQRCVKTRGSLQDGLQLHFNELVQDLHSWLAELKLELKECSNQSGDVVILEAKLRRLKVLIEQTSEGEESLSKICEEAESLQLHLPKAGVAQVQEHLSSCQREWRNYLDSCSQSQRDLEESIGLLKNFDECVEGLRDWLKQMELSLKSEPFLGAESQQGAPDTTEELERMENLHKELLARRDSIERACQEAQSLSEAGRGSGGEVRVTGQLQMDHQALLKAARERLRGCQESQAFGETLQGVWAWLEEIQERLGTVDSTMGTKEQLEQRLETVQDILLLKGEGEVKLNMAMGKGELALRSYGAAGQDVVRSQLQEVEDAWATLLVTAMSCHSRLEWTVTQWGGYLDSAAQLRCWMEAVEREVCAPLTPQPGPREKASQLERLRALLADLEDHQVALSSLEEKARELFKKTGDASFNHGARTQLQAQFDDLTALVEERVRLAQAVVLEHQEYLEAVRELTDWLMTVGEELQHWSDTSGDSTSIKKKLSEVRERVECRLLEGRERFSRVRRSAATTAEHTAAGGCEAMDRQLGALSQALEQWEGAALRARDGLEGALAAAAASEEEYNRLTARLEDELKELDGRLRRWGQELIKAEGWSNGEEAVEGWQLAKDILEGLQSAEPMAEKLKGQLNDLVRYSRDLGSQSDRVTAVIKQHNSLSLRASRECQNKERLLEQRFRTALRDFQQWLVNAKISTAKCFDVPQSVTEASTALQRIQEFLSDREHGQARLSTVGASGELLMAVVSRDRVEGIKAKVVNARDDWKSLMNNLQMREDALKNLQSQMTEFEASAEPLQDWLNSTEVRVQESSARLHDLPAKKQELSKLQCVLEEIASREAELGRLRERAHRLWEGQAAGKGFVHRVSQLSAQYLALSNLTKDKASRIERIVGEHRLFSQGLKELQDWVCEAQRVLNTCISTTTDKGLLEERMLQLEALLAARQEREIQLKMLLTRGEAVQRNTSAEGVPVIRKQIQDLKDSWDSLLSASIQCKSQLEGALSQWTSYQEDVGQFVLWMDRVEETLSCSDRQYSEMRDKTANLGKTKLLYEEVLSHSSPLETIATKGSNMAEHYTTQQEVQQLQCRYNTLKEKAKGLHVFEDWLEQEQASLASLSHPEGNVDTLEKTLQQLQLLQDRCSNGQSLLSSVLTSRERVIPWGIPQIEDRALDTAQREWGAYQGRLEETQTHLNSTLTRLRQMGQRFLSLAQWLEEMEKVANIRRHRRSDRANKGTQLKKLQGCLEAVLARQGEVDGLSSLAQQVLEETYISSRVSVTATQLTAHYHSLLLNIQDTIKQLQEELKSIEEAENLCMSFTDWLSTTQKSFMVLTDTSEPLDRVAMEKKMKKLEILQSELQHGHTFLKSLRERAEQAAGFLDEAGAESLGGEVEARLAQLEELAGGLRQEHSFLERALLLAKEFQDRYRAQAQWLVETRAFLNTPVEPKAELYQRRAQLAKYKALLQMVQSHDGSVRSVVEKGDALLASIHYPSIREKMNRLQRDYAELCKRAVTHVENLEGQVKEQEAYHNELQEVERWLLQMSSRMVTPDPTVGGTLEAATQQLARHKAIMEEIAGFEDRLAGLKERGDHLVQGCSDRVQSRLRQQVQAHQQGTRDSYSAICSTAQRVYQSLDHELQRHVSLQDTLQQCQTWLTSVSEEPEPPAHPPLSLEEALQQVKQERTLQEQASTYLQLVCSTCDLSEPRVRETAAAIQQVKLQNEERMLLCEEVADSWRDIEEQKADLEVQLRETEQQLQNLIRRPAELEPKIAQNQLDKAQEFLQQIKERQSEVTHLNEAIGKLTDGQVSPALEEIKRLRRSWMDMGQRAEELEAQRGEDMQRSGEYQESVVAVEELFHQVSREWDYLARADTESTSEHLEALRKLSSDLEEQRATLEDLRDQRQAILPRLSLLDKELVKQQVGHLEQRWAQLENLIQQKIQDSAQTLEDLARVETQLRDAREWVEEQRPALTSALKTSPPPDLAQSFLFDHLSVCVELEARQQLLGQAVSEAQAVASRLGLSEKRCLQGLVEHAQTEVEALGARVAQRRKYLSKAFTERTQFLQGLGRALSWVQQQERKALIDDHIALLPEDLAKQLAACRGVQRGLRAYQRELASLWASEYENLLLIVQRIGQEILRTLNEIDHCYLDERLNALPQQYNAILALAKEKKDRVQQIILERKEFSTFFDITRNALEELQEQFDNLEKQTISIKEEDVVCLINEYRSINESLFHISPAVRELYGKNQGFLCRGQQYRAEETQQLVGLHNALKRRIDQKIKHLDNCLKTLLEHDKVFTSVDSELKSVKEKLVQLKSGEEVGAIEKITGLYALLERLDGMNSQTEECNHQTEDLGLKFEPAAFQEAALQRESLQSLQFEVKGFVDTTEITKNADFARETETMLLWLRTIKDKLKEPLTFSEVKVEKVHEEVRKMKIMEEELRCTLKIKDALGNREKQRYCSRKESVPVHVEENLQEATELGAEVQDGISKKQMVLREALSLVQRRHLSLQSMQKWLESAAVLLQRGSSGVELENQTDCVQDLEEISVQEKSFTAGLDELRVLDPLLVDFMEPGVMSGLRETVETMQMRNTEVKQQLDAYREVLQRCTALWSSFTHERETLVEQMNDAESKMAMFTTAKATSIQQAEDKCQRYKSLVAHIDLLELPLNALKENAAELEHIISESSKGVTSHSVSSLWQRWTRLRSVARAQERALEDTAREWRNFTEKMEKVRSVSKDLHSRVPDSTVEKAATRTALQSLLEYHDSFSQEVEREQSILALLRQHTRSLRGEEEEKEKEAMEKKTENGHEEAPCLQKIQSMQEQYDSLVLRVRASRAQVHQELREREEVEKELGLVKGWIQDTRGLLLSPTADLDSLLQELETAHGEVISRRQSVERMTELQQSKYQDLQAGLPSELSMQLAEVALALGSAEDQVQAREREVQQTRDVKEDFSSRLQDIETKLKTITLKLEDKSGNLEEAKEETKALCEECESCCRSLVELGVAVQEFGEQNPLLCKQLGDAVAKLTEVQRHTTQQVQERANRLKKAERQVEEYQGMKAFILGWTEKAEALVSGNIVWSSASQLQEQIRAHQALLRECRGLHGDLEAMGEREGQLGEVLQLEGWSQQVKHLSRQTEELQQTAKTRLQSLQDAAKDMLRLEAEVKSLHAAVDQIQRLLVEMEGFKQQVVAVQQCQSALRLPEEVVASLPICRTAQTLQQEASQLQHTTIQQCNILQEAVVQYEQYEQEVKNLQRLIEEAHRIIQDRPELAQKIRGYQEQIASLHSKCKMLTVKAKHATMLLTVSEVDGLSDGMDELSDEELPCAVATATTAAAKQLPAHPSVVMMTAGRCHTLLSPVTEESGEEGTNSEVSSPPACRSPSPGANADAPLNQGRGALSRAPLQELYDPSMETSAANLDDLQRSWETLKNVISEKQKSLYEALERQQHYQESLQSISTKMESIEGALNEGLEPNKSPESQMAAHQALMDEILMLQDEIGELQTCFSEELADSDSDGEAGDQLALQSTLTVLGERMATIRMKASGKRQLLEEKLSEQLEEQRQEQALQRYHNEAEELDHWLLSTRATLSSALQPQNEDMDMEEQLIDCQNMLFEIEQKVSYLSELSVHSESLLLEGRAETKGEAEQLSLKLRSLKDSLLELQQMLQDKQGSLQEQEDSEPDSSLSQSPNVQDWLSQARSTRTQQHHDNLLRQRELQEQVAEQRKLLQSVASVGEELLNHQTTPNGDSEMSIPGGVLLETETLSPLEQLRQRWENLNKDQSTKLQLSLTTLEQDQLSPVLHRSRLSSPSMVFRAESGSQDSQSPRVLFETCSQTLERIAQEAAGSESKVATSLGGVTVQQDLYAAVSAASSWLDAAENQLLSGPVLLSEDTETQLTNLEGLNKQLKEMTKEVNQCRDLLGGGAGRLCGREEQALMEDTLEGLQERMGLLDSTLEQHCDSMRDRLQEHSTFQNELRMLFTALSESKHQLLQKMAGTADRPASKQIEALSEVEDSLREFEQRVSELKTRAEGLQSEQISSQELLKLQDAYEELMLMVGSRRSSLNHGLSLKAQYEAALHDLTDLVDTAQDKMAADQKMTVASVIEVQMLLKKHKSWSRLVEDYQALCRQLEAVECSIPTVGLVEETEERLTERISLYQNQLTQLGEHWLSSTTKVNKELHRLDSTLKHWSRYQSESAELSHWLQSALDRLEFWTTQSVTVPQELETVRDHLYAFLEFSKEVDAKSSLRSSVLSTGNQLLRLKRVDTAGLRTALGQIDTQWAELLTRIPVVQEKLHQLQMEKLASRHAITELMSWISLMENIIDEDQDKIMGAVGSELVQNFLQKYKGFRIDLTCKQLTVDFVNQSVLQISSQDVEGKRSDKTDFAEKLGAMNRRWQILQGLIAEKIQTLEGLLESWLEHENGVQALKTWLTLQEEKLKKRHRIEDVASVQNALKDCQELEELVKEKEKDLEKAEERGNALIQDKKGATCSVVKETLKGLNQSWAHLDHMISQMKVSLKSVLEQWTLYRRASEEINGYLMEGRYSVSRLQLLNGSLEAVQQQVESLENLQEEMDKQESSLRKFGSVTHQLLTECHPSVAETLNRALRDVNIRWNSLLEQISEQLRSSKALLGLWQRYRTLYGQCVTAVQKQEEHANRLLKSATDREITEEESITWIEDCNACLGDQASVQDSLQQLQSLGEQLKSQVDASSSAALQSDHLSLTHRLATLEHALHRQQEVLQSGSQACDGFREQLDRLMRKAEEAEEVLKECDSVGSPELHVVQARMEKLKVHLLKLSSLSPDLERVNELVYRQPVSDKDVKQLQSLNRAWAAHCAHLTERFSKLQAVVLQQQSFLQKCEAWMDFLSQTEKKLAAEISGNYQSLLEQQRDHELFQAEMFSRQQILYSIISDGHHMLDQGQVDDRDDFSLKLALLSNQWQCVVRRAQQRRGIIDSLVRQWQNYREMAEKLLRWLQEVTHDPDVHQPGEAVALQQARNLLDQIQLRERVLQRQQGGYILTVEAGRSLLLSADARAESTLQAELMEIQERTGSDELESSVEGWTDDLPSLFRLRDSLEGVVSSDDITVLQERLQLLQRQWEEVCHQLSLRKQQVSEKLNEWAVFNEKNKELCEWLTQMESKVSQNGDISIEEMIEKLRKDYQEEISVAQENKQQLQVMGERLARASQDSKAAEIQHKLSKVSERWQHLLDLIAARVKKLRETLVAVQQLDKNMSSLRSWLAHIETELSRPIVLLHDCDACSTETECDSIQQATRGLDRRWRNICAMSMERRLKIEETWRLWQKFLDDYSRFEDWLKTSERTAALPNSSGVLYTVAKEELKKFEAFQRQVQECLTQLELINKQYRRLARENRTDSSCRLREMVHDGNKRWDNLQKRVAAILRRLRHFISQREEFETARDSILVWLTEMDLQLTNIEHFSECDVQAKIKQLRAFQQEIYLNTGKIELVFRQGEALIEKSEPLDAAVMRRSWRSCRDILADDELDGSDRELDVEEGADLSELQWGDSSLPRTSSRQATAAAALIRADRSGRDTPASVDSIPLEWDHDYDLSRGLESPGGRGHGERSRGQEEEDEYLRTAAAVLSDVVIPESPEAYIKLTEDTLKSSSGVIERWELIQAQSLSEKHRQKQNLQQWQQLITDLQTMRAWLGQSEAELNQLRGLDLSTDIHTIQQRIKKLKELQKGMDTHKSEVLSINLSSADFLQSEPDSEEAWQLRDGLKEMNLRWDRLRASLEDWREELQTALMQCQEFHEMSHGLLLWLENIDRRRNEVVPIPPKQIKCELLDSQQKVSSLQELSTQLLVNTKPQTVPTQSQTSDQIRAQGSECLEAQEKVHVIWNRLRLLLREVSSDLEGLERRLEAMDTRQGCLPLPVGISEFCQSAAPVSDVTVESRKRLPRGKSSQAHPGHPESGPRHSRSRSPGAAGCVSSRSDLPDGISSSSSSSSSSKGQSFLLRVLRAALPVQLLLLLLIGLACLVPMTEEDYSCHHANNFARSFHPMLRYTNGPPPI